MTSQLTRTLAIKIELLPEHINTLSEVLNEAVSQIDAEAPSCVLNLIVEHPAKGEGTLLLAVIEGSISEGGKLIEKDSVKISRCNFEVDLNYEKK